MPEYTNTVKLWAWENATVIPGMDPNRYRKDSCGAIIAWDKYGERESLFGWEIDHIYPLSMGGTTRKENMRAMQHQNNASKGNRYPYYTAAMTAEGSINVPCNKTLVVNAVKRAELATIYPKP